ncbi:hypothetical protein OnM2_101024, partial [Erysiphe neolycopersici]
MLAVQSIEIPDEVVPLDLDPYICLSTPIFQVQQPTEPAEDNNSSQSPVWKGPYSTPSPTASREMSQEIEQESNIS